MGIFLYQGLLSHIWYLEIQISTSVRVLLEALKFTRMAGAAAVFSKVPYQKGKIQKFSVSFYFCTSGVILSWCHCPIADVSTFLIENCCEFNSIIIDLVC